MAEAETITFHENFGDVAKSPYGGYPVNEDGSLGGYKSVMLNPKKDMAGQEWTVTDGSDLKAEHVKLTNAEGQSFLVAKGTFDQAQDFNRIAAKRAAKVEAPKAAAAAPAQEAAAPAADTPSYAFDNPAWGETTLAGASNFRMEISAEGMRHLGQSHITQFQTYAQNDQGVYKPDGNMPLAFHDDGISAHVHVTPFPDGHDLPGNEEMVKLNITQGNETFTVVTTAEEFIEIADRLGVEVPEGGITSRLPQEPSVPEAAAAAPAQEAAAPAADTPKTESVSANVAVERKATEGAAQIDLGDISLDSPAQAVPASSTPLTGNDTDISAIHQAEMVVHGNSSGTNPVTGIPDVNADTDVNAIHQAEMVVNGADPHFPDQPDPSTSTASNVAPIGVQSTVVRNAKDQWREIFQRMKAATDPNSPSFIDFSVGNAFANLGKLMKQVMPGFGFGEKFGPLFAQLDKMEVLSGVGKAQAEAGAKPQQDNAATPAPEQTVPQRDFASQTVSV